MDINPLHARHLDLSNIPLDNLAANTQATEKDKIGEVSRAFEAVLLRQILQEGQKPAFASKLIGNSATDGIYRDMVVNQMADSISKSGSFGLARSLAGQLQRQTGSAKVPVSSIAAQPSRVANLRPVSVRGLETQPKPAALTTSAKPAAPAQFKVGKRPPQTTHP